MADANAVHVILEPGLDAPQALVDASAHAAPSRSPDAVQAEKAEIIVVCAADDGWAADSLRWFRARPALFLKPLLLLSASANGAPSALADGVLPLASERAGLDQELGRLRRIAGRVAGLQEPEEQGRLEELLLLRYLHTRDRGSLEPVPDTRSWFGYSFPLVQCMTGSPAGRELDLLDALYEAHFLNAEMVDKVHCCPFCEHAYVNFREVCPHCGSLEYTEEPAIHHFRCGYVGRQSGFAQGTGLLCPKCHGTLRHIGVDYDKPTSHLWCTLCGKSFPEPQVQCFCFECRKEFRPEHAVLRTIRRFGITREGRSVAEDGVFPPVSVADLLRSSVGFYRPEVFEEMVRLEALRCTRYGYDSTLVRLSLKGLEELAAAEGVLRARKLAQELAELLRGAFRETDMLTQLGAQELLIIFTHTTAGRVETALKRLGTSLDRLLTRPVDLQFTAHDLRNETRPLDAILGEGG